MLQYTGTFHLAQTPSIKPFRLPRKKQKNKKQRKKPSHFIMRNKFISFLSQLPLTVLCLVVTFITKSAINVIN